MHRFATAALALLLLLAFPGSVQAAVISDGDRVPGGGWSDPRPLGRHTFDVEIAANPAGDMVAMWSSEERGLRARFRPAGERWGPVERVSLAKYSHVDEGSLTLGARGRATVLWQNDAGLQVSDRAPDGTWRRDRTAPLVHEDPEGCGDEWVSERPMFAGGYGRTLFVSWEELGCDEGYSSFEHYAWRLPDGSWTRLRDGAGGAEQHAMVLLGKRRAVMVTTGGGVWVQRLRAGDRVRQGRPLVAAGNYSTLDLSRNRHGDLALVAASYGVPIGNHILMMAKVAGESWGPPHRTPFTGSFPAVSVGVGDDGTAIAGWVERGPRTQVWAQVGDVHAGKWEMPSTISGATRTEVGQIDVATTDDGDGVVVWARTEWPYTLSTHASVRRAGGTWRAPVRLAGKSAKWVRPAPNVVSAGDRFTALFVRKSALASDKRMR